MFRFTLKIDCAKAKLQIQMQYLLRIYLIYAMSYFTEIIHSVDNTDVCDQ